MYCFMSSLPPPLFSFFFFFNDTATTEIYTLSLHDALPIFRSRQDDGLALPRRTGAARARARPVCERDVGGHGRGRHGAAASARGRLPVPGLCPLSPFDGRREHHVCDPRPRQQGTTRAA